MPEQDAHGPGGTAHQRGAVGAQAAQGVGEPDAARQVGPVGELEQGVGVGGVLGPGQTVHLPHRRLREQLRDGGRPGLAVRLDAESRDVTGPQPVQQGQAGEEFRQGAGPGQDVGDVAEPFVRERGQTALRRPFEPFEGLCGRRPSLVALQAPPFPQDAFGGLCGCDSAHAGRGQHGRRGRGPAHFPAGGEGFGAARADDLPDLPVGHPAHRQPAQQQFAAPVEVGAQRVQPQVP